MILYWVRSLITDKRINFSGPDIVYFDRQHTTALIINIAVPLTHNLPKITAEENKKIKTWPWKSDISGSLKTYLCIRVKNFPA